MIKISTATEAHFAIIQEIASKTWPVTFKDILSPEQIGYMLDMMYSREALRDQTQVMGHKFLLASYSDNFTEETYVGYASCRVNQSDSGKTKIHKIYILPQYQGKGAGNALINKVEHIASEYGDRALFLNVNKSNPAIKFYQKIGFKIVKEENIPIGKGFFMDDYVMEKTLV